MECVYAELTPNFLWFSKVVNLRKLVGLNGMWNWLKLGCCGHIPGRGADFLQFSIEDIRNKIFSIELLLRITENFRISDIHY